MGFGQIVRSIQNSIRAPTGKGGEPHLYSAHGGRLYGVGGGGINPEQAMRLSAVYSAINIRSDDMSVIPYFCMNQRTKERPDHPIMSLLSGRPNELMSRMVQEKFLETSILITGNAYEWIIRDENGKPVELIPLAGNYVQMWVDQYRRAWYTVTNQITGEQFTLPNEDICHYKGISLNGLLGEGVLAHARESIRAGIAAQDYNTSFYESGCHVAGALTLDGDLSGYVLDSDGNSTGKTKKDAMREEWDKVYGGAKNAHKVAILDHGMKYQSLTVSQADAQFIEQSKATIEDISRYFGVPLYKLQAGSQSYNANEQNAIEYVKVLQPRVTQLEQERTYKLLKPSERAEGLVIKANMRALLRADDKSRADYYSAMKYNGYTINDILNLEDMPPVAGGDVTFASLNYVPLEHFERLSNQRNGGDGNGEN